MAQAETSDNAYQIQIQLDYAMDTARTLAANLTTMVEEQKADRALTDAMFQRILNNNEQFMGVWSVWEPNAFDGQDENTSIQIDMIQQDAMFHSGREMAIGSFILLL